MELLERMRADGPKRILALDGGGIRGAITIGYLREIERILRERHQNHNLVLCDYFDLIGGTSTGAIIAGLLAIGKSTDEVLELYLSLGEKIFAKKRSWWWNFRKRLKAKFDAGPLVHELRNQFGGMTLGDSRIRTGLCVVTKRADTQSVWPLINHPEGAFYGANKHMPLWEVVRASTAAPTYFIPEEVNVGNEIGAFVDGGVSMANNPSLQLFLVTVLNGFPYRWKTGENQLLLMSVGTGYWSRRDTVKRVVKRNLKNWAEEVPGMLMEDADWQNQLLMQFLSNSPTAVTIDGEVGDLAGDSLAQSPLLSYVRYNVALETQELRELGVESPDVESIRKLDEGDNRHVLASIGQKSAKRLVDAAHIPPAFDVH